MYRAKTVQRPFVEGDGKLYKVQSNQQRALLKVRTFSSSAKPGCFASPTSREEGEDIQASSIALHPDAQKAEPIMATAIPLRCVLHLATSISPHLAACVLLRQLLR
jgi:hypothetical protein